MGIRPGALRALRALHSPTGKPPTGGGLPGSDGRPTSHSPTARAFRWHRPAQRVTALSQIATSSTPALHPSDNIVRCRAGPTGFRPPAPGVKPPACLASSRLPSLRRESASGAPNRGGPPVACWAHCSTALPRASASARPSHALRAATDPARVTASEGLRRQSACRAWLWISQLPLVKLVAAQTRPSPLPPTRPDRPLPLTPCPWGPYPTPSGFPIEVGGKGALIRAIPRAGARERDDPAAGRRFARLCAQCAYCVFVRGRACAAKARRAWRGYGGRQFRRARLHRRQARPCACSLRRRPLARNSALRAFKPMFVPARLDLDVCPRPTSGRGSRAKSRPKARSIVT